MSEKPAMHEWIIRTHRDQQGQVGTQVRAAYSQVVDGLMFFKDDSGAIVYTVAVSTFADAYRTGQYRWDGDGSKRSVVDQLREELAASRGVSNELRNQVADLKRELECARVPSR